MIHERPSPNCNNRPVGVRPTLLVIHGTAGKSDAGDVAWCCDPQAKVSYHYIIGRDGQVYRLVPDEKRAWHAGVSSWQDRPGCNDYSIGLGFSNSGKEPFTDAQYKAGGKLVLDLLRKHTIKPQNVVGHYHVSPGRKTDPWYSFDWSRLWAEVLGCAGVVL